MCSVFLLFVCSLWLDSIFTINCAVFVQVRVQERIIKALQHQLKASEKRTQELEDAHEQIAELSAHNARLATENQQLETNVRVTLYSTEIYLEKASAFQMSLCFIATCKTSLFYMCI